MLGIIIDAPIMEDDDFQHRIFHKFQEKSSLERVAEASLRSEYAHRVIVSLPTNLRVYAVGTTYRDTVIDRNITALERTATYAFYAHSWLDRLYYAARDYHLDTIVRIRADCPFIPTWLINEVIYEYHQEPNVFLHTHSLIENNDELYQEGFNIEVMPFWMLARAKIYLDDDSDYYDYIVNNFKVKEFKNIKNSQNYIHPVNFSLLLNNKEQIPKFDALAEALLYDDIGDVLEGISDGES